jgi:hypothetical protein
MTAKEKELVLKAWVRFLKGGLKRSDFTKKLYCHLINHCSFIAHYNLGGFYSTYFESGDTIVKFLSQFDNRGSCCSIEYGGIGWRKTEEYYDINRAMIKEASRFVPLLIIRASTNQQEEDVRVAKSLLAKHNIYI